MPNRLAILAAVLMMVLGTAAPSPAQEEGEGLPKVGNGAPPAGGCEESSVDCGSDVDVVPEGEVYDHVPGEFIVGYESEEAMLAAPRENVVETIPLPPTIFLQRLRFDEIANIADPEERLAAEEAKRQELLSLPGVKYVEYNGIARIQSAGGAAQDAATQVAQEDPDQADADQEAEADDAATLAAEEAARAADAALAAGEAGQDAGDSSGSAVEGTAAYLAALEAARDAGAAEETAREIAEEAVALSDEETDAGEDTGEAGSGEDAAEEAAGDGAATGEGAVRGSAASKDTTRKGEDRKGAAGKAAASRGGAEEDTEEGTATGDEAGSVEEDGGGDTAVAAPVGSRAPLLFGGVILLAAGSYVALRAFRSWSQPARGRRFLRH